MPQHCHPDTAAGFVEAPAGPVAFRIDFTVYGHAHVRHEGSYTGPATVEDVRREFFHPLFGGRDEWCADGRWGCIVHTD